MARRLPFELGCALEGVVFRHSQHQAAMAELQLEQGFQLGGRSTLPMLQQFFHGDVFADDAEMADTFEQQPRDVGRRGPKAGQQGDCDRTRTACPWIGRTRARSAPAATRTCRRGDRISGWRFSGGTFSIRAQGQGEKVQGLKAQGFLGSICRGRGGSRRCRVRGSGLRGRWW